MKLVANIQLTPTKADAQVLKQTLETCNKACTEASRVGFEKLGMKVRQYNLQPLTYRQMREDFGRMIYAAVCCRRRVFAVRCAAPNPLRT
jgi:putative transposase